MEPRAWKIIAVISLLAQIIILFCLYNGLSISFLFIHSVDIVGFLSILLLIFLHFQGNGAGAIAHQSVSESTMQAVPQNSEQAIERQNRYGSLKEKNNLPREFVYEDLKQATNNFRDMLSTGESSSVFKGFMKDGTVVAVKRFERRVYSRWDFLREISTVAKIDHIHLLSLLGFCHVTIEEKKFFFIVYEYLSKGSLDSWIFPRGDDFSAPCLSWNQRYNIAVDVAIAISYLHQNCCPKIVNINVKPENILLDDFRRPVLSDFGFPKLVLDDNSGAPAISRKSKWYKAPEWDEYGNEVSEKCDIFSFGQLLLDLFFCKRYVCLDKRGNDIYTDDGNSQLEKRTCHAFILEKLRHKKFNDLIDKEFLIVDETEASCLLYVALWCLKEHPTERPGDMQQVVDFLRQKKLEEIATLLITGTEAMPSLKKRSKEKPSDKLQKRGMIDQKKVDKSSNSDEADVSTIEADQLNVQGSFDDDLHGSTSTPSSTFPKNSRYELSYQKPGAKVNNPCDGLSPELRSYEVAINITLGSSDHNPQWVHNLSCGMPHKSQPHEHYLDLLNSDEPYTCDGCKEIGVGLRYRCEPCNFDLHKDCMFFSLSKYHPFYTNCNFKFMEKPPGDRLRNCNACGSDIKGFVYHCTNCGRDLHPCCMNLPLTIKCEEEELRLSETVMSACSFCGREDLQRRVTGWSYTSNNYNFHDSCIKEMLMNNWTKNKLGHDENSMTLADRNPNLQQIPLFVNANASPRGGGARRNTKIARLFIKDIASTILGGSTARIVGFIESLLPG